ncbi:MAG: thiamine pyrophosphate-dependent enzyme, partial [Bacteroidota bacterium]
KGHSISDPAKYRTKEEVEEYKAQDPIVQCMHAILEKEYASEEDLKAIEKKVKDQVEESIKFADESPFPPAEEALQDVYMQEDYPFILD